MYKLYKTDMAQGLIRLSDNAFIPLDPDNTDYQFYLAWVAEGGQPLSAEA